MALTTLTIRVHESEADYLDRLASQHEGILSKQGVMRLLLQYAEASGWSPLDKPPGKANNQEQPAQHSDSDATAVPKIPTPPVSLSSTAKPATTHTQTGAFQKAELHPELETAREAFVRYGSIKKGDRGEHGAKLAATGLRKIGEKYGWDVARDQLDLAINNRWAGISLTNYEKFLPKAATPAQPEVRHPASRVFTAKDFDHGPTTNPALEGLF